MIEFVLLSIPSLIYALVKRGKTSDWRRALALVWPTARGWGLGILAAVVGAGLGWLALRGVPPEVMTAQGTTGAITSVLGGLMVALRAVGEEVFFRGFLQGLAERRWGAVAGVVIQAVVFTLPHLALLTVNVALAPLVVTQAVTGVILGWVRLRTGSIAPTSLAHVIVNLASGLAMAASVAVV